MRRSSLWARGGDGVGTGAEGRIAHHPVAYGIRSQTIPDRMVSRRTGTVDSRTRPDDNRPTQPAASLDTGPDTSPDTSPEYWPRILTPTLAHTPMKRSLWSFASLVALGLAGWQMADTLARTPAFNPGLQTEAANGSKRPASARVMYDRARYHLWTGRGWYHHACSGQLAGDEGSEEERQAALAARAAACTRARTAARESLRHNPGDPNSWMLLARAEAMLDHRDAALEAWTHAREVAPNSALRARDRLVFLARFMEDPEGAALALATVPAESVREDFRIIRQAKAFVHHTDTLARHPGLTRF